MKRGSELDDVIEKELQMMLLEGYEKAPISHKLLHNRLSAKGHLSGGLSTLSTSNRKHIINTYQAKQIECLNLKSKDQQLFVNKKTRQALINTNKELRKQIDNIDIQMHQNTETLMDIIEEVKLKTSLKIDHLLAPHLLKRYLSK